MCWRSRQDSNLRPSVIKSVGQFSSRGGECLPLTSEAGASKNGNEHRPISLRMRPMSRPCASITS
jgi:hypothetical protein